MEESLDFHPSSVHATLTVSTTVVDFSDASTTPIVDKMVKVVFQVDPAGGNARMTKDGATDPVGATTGIRLDAGDIVELTRTEAINAKFIRDASADATLQIQGCGTKV